MRTTRNNSSSVSGAAARGFEWTNSDTHGNAAGSVSQPDGEAKGRCASVWMPWDGFDLPPLSMLCVVCKRDGCVHAHRWLCERRVSGAAAAQPQQTDRQTDREGRSRPIRSIRHDAAHWSIASHRIRIRICIVVASSHHDRMTLTPLTTNSRQRATEQSNDARQLQPSDRRDKKGKQGAKSIWSTTHTHQAS